MIEFQVIYYYTYNIKVSKVIIPDWMPGSVLSKVATGNTLLQYLQAVKYICIIDSLVPRLFPWPGYEASIID